MNRFSQANKLPRGIAERDSAFDSFRAESKQDEIASEREAHQGKTSGEGWASKLNRSRREGVNERACTDEGVGDPKEHQTLRQ
jgi:hypothetical protein